MGPIGLPSIAGVGDLVTMLVGRRVKVSEAAPLPVGAARGVATYIDAGGEIHFVALLDMAFLAGVGAALAMIPRPTVDDAIKSGKPSSVLVDNALEVMNVIASLCNDLEGKGTHMTIQRLVVAPPVASELAPRLLKPASRTDYDVELPGYANGKLSFLALVANGVKT